MAEARRWVQHFVNWYNTEHKHSGINYVSPAERHKGEDKEILEKRKQVYEEAKAKHPERWSKETRDWTLTEKVYLNPERMETKEILLEIFLTSWIGTFLWFKSMSALHKQKSKKNDALERFYCTIC